MCNQIIMCVGYSTDNLFKKEPSVLFRNIIVLYKVIKLSPLCKFHNYEDIVGRIEHFV
jgi:hypothetical protein